MSTSRRKRPLSEEEDREDEEAGEAGMNDLELVDSTVRRRKLRVDLREHIDTIRTNKGDLVRADAKARPKTEELLEKGEELFLGVDHTREFVLDAEAKRDLGKIVAQQAEHIDVALSSDSPAEFVSKARAWMARLPAEVSDEARWSALAKLAARHFSTCPGPYFLYGPIPTVPRPVAQRKAREQKDSVGAAKRVEELKEDEEDPNAVSSATMAQVDDLAKKLKAAHSVPVWELVVNPKSMAQTVEHMFHLSFLVKEGKAKVSVGRDGPEVRPAEPPSDKADDLKKVQAIVRLDTKTLNDVAQRYRIDPNKPFIPHRTPVPASRTQQPASSSPARRSGARSLPMTSPAVDPTQIVESPALEGDVDSVAIRSSGTPVQKGGGKRRKN